MTECGIIITVSLACRWRKTLLQKMQTKKELLFGLENVSFSRYRHVFVKNSEFGVKQNIIMKYNF